MAKVYDELGGYDNVNIFQSGFQGEEQDPFYTGKIGMVINGKWILNGIARYAPGLDFGVAPAPVPAARLRGEGPLSRVEPNLSPGAADFPWRFPKARAHSKEAWRFIKWMTRWKRPFIGAEVQKA